VTFILIVINWYRRNSGKN